MTLANKSHFELFGLPERFELDRDALEAAYHQVQRAVHPDRFAHAGSADRRAAVQWAAQANEALATLRDPVRRGAYLAERRGAAVHAESNTAMPAQFLAEQMQWRETLDDAREAGDATAVRHLAAEVAAARDRAIDALRAALDEHDDPTEAAALVRRLMFMDRFATDLSAAQHG
jgi:molecular chaperone HscB